MLFKIILAAIIGSVCGVFTFNIVKKLNVIKESRDDKFTLLQKYSSYDVDTDEAWTFNKMVMYQPVTELLQRYNYASYCENVNRNSDDIVFAMLDFVCDHFDHCGNASLPIKHGLNDIINYCEKSGMKTNCRGLSLVLAELLRMNGVQARHVTCMPYEEPFHDCHVVVDCVLPSGERIMLDPTYRLYFKDSGGKYVSIELLRKGILEKKRFTPNANASYNGTEFAYDDYIEYMTKNVFRFATNYNMDDTDNFASERIELIPKGYMPNKTVMTRRYTNNPIMFWKMSYEIEKYVGEL